MTPDRVDPRLNLYCVLFRPAIHRSFEFDSDRHCRWRAGRAGGSRRTDGKRFSLHDHRVASQAWWPGEFVP